MTRALGPSHIEGELRPDVSSVDREIEEARAQLASAEARIAFLGESNHRVAREKYGEALRIYRELGCDEQVAETLFRLGEVCRELGEASRAIEMFDEALSIFQRLQAKERVGYVLLELGEILFGEGLFRDAEARLKEALMVLKGLRKEGGTAAAFFQLGGVLEVVDVFRLLGVHFVDEGLGVSSMSLRNHVVGLVHYLGGVGDEGLRGRVISLVEGVLAPPEGVEAPVEDGVSADSPPVV